MQKWEYLILIQLDEKYLINGVKYNYQPNENLFTIMARLGGEGWELTSEPDLFTHTFKRPVE
jgi:hypothetical protein